MRILFVAPYPPARDGIGDYTERLVHALAERGHEVRVITPRPLAGASEVVIGALPRSHRELPGLVARIDAFAPDVVHVQFAVAAFAAATPVLLHLLEALRPRRTFVAVTLHELLRDTKLLRRVGRTVYRRLAELTDRVVVHTNAARAALAGPVGAAVVHCAVVPHPRVEPPAAVGTAEQLRVEHRLGDARVLLAFGFVHVDKGLGDLVRALGLLGTEFDVRLVVAGAVRGRSGVFLPFEWYDRLHLVCVRRVVRRASLEKRVHFTGYVPAGDVRAWFELADAAVLPYRRIDQSGVASLAAATNTPVLLSRAGGLAEGAVERWTFPPRSPECLSAVLADFLRTREAGEPAGAADAAGPDIAAFAELTLSLYRSDPSTFREEHVRAQVA
jgi:glycosyltransferase involved in cell wall biosynthesis